MHRRNRIQSFYSKLLFSLYVIVGLILLFIFSLKISHAATTTPVQIAESAAIPTPLFNAALIDVAQKAKKRAATVEVTISNIELVDADKVYEKPKPGQAHIHYQLDNGPIIATTSTKLSFHELSSGTHTIVVRLAANDHQPMGPQKTLTFNIP